MLRIYVYPMVREFMLCDALKAALRAAKHHVCDDLETDPLVNVVIAPIESVADSCRLITQVIDRRPATAVVALGDRCAEDEIVALIEAGAKAYVDRSQSLAQLLFTVDAVVQKRAPASSRVTAQVIRKIQHFTEDVSPSARVDALTQRERAILHLMARGCSNKQIAASLAISSNTVKNHVHQILEKLRVRGRREAARIALLSDVPGRMSPLKMPAVALS
jgi:two-component system nitrate/nitrite response regulator NarL